MKPPIERRRRGNVMLLACVLTVCLLGFVALAVDLGYVAHAHTELQRTADAISLAAASQLPNEATALAAASDTVAANQTIIQASLEPGDVEFGWWNRNNSTFISPPPANRSVNAVRVTIGRTEDRGNPLNLFLGPLVGTSATDITVRSTAFMDRGVCGPFIGIESLTASGNVNTDSFDSRDEPYDPDTAGHRGSLCSDGPITINGNPYIKGDVRAGEGQPITVHGAAAEITGNIGNRVKPLNMPSVDDSEVALDNDNDILPGIPNNSGMGSTPALDGQRNFRLTGNKTYTFPPGRYYINDMDLSGMSVVNFIGPTVIYLTGNLSRTGGVAVNNNTLLAENLKIFMTGGSAKITSHNDFYGVLYAPDSEVDLSGTADYFGAIVGRVLRLVGNSTGHYDESLNFGEVETPTRTTIVD